MLVSHILNEKGHAVLAIAPEATLAEAARVLTKHRIGALIVRDKDGALTGVVSERDIVRAVAQDGAGALVSTVEQRMTKDAPTCERTDTIEEIMETMTRCRFRHMPVMEEDRRHRHRLDRRRGQDTHRGNLTRSPGAEGIHRRGLTLAPARPDATTALVHFGRNPHSDGSETLHAVSERTRDGHGPRSV